MDMTVNPFLPPKIPGMSGICFVCNYWLATAGWDTEFAVRLERGKAWNF